MIREMTKSDFVAFWPCFRRIISAQETYALVPDMTMEEAFTLWCIATKQAYVFEENGQILGTYYIKANAMGAGSHVCNCGDMVDPNARGRGIAKVMCEHSQRQARLFGFTAMQFNAVVATNTIAVKLWQQLGFSIVGTIPDAYQHRREGLVDCHVMYKSMDVNEAKKSESQVR